MKKVLEQKTFNFPIILDVTHSLQLPGGQGNSAGGRSHQAEDLARAAIALKISGLFIEVHPNPDEALCDGFRNDTRDEKRVRTCTHKFK